MGSHKCQLFKKTIRAQEVQAIFSDTQESSEILNFGRVESKRVN
jgi:hypothetical protein